MMYSFSTQKSLVLSWTHRHFYSSYRVFSWAIHFLPSHIGVRRPTAYSPLYFRLQFPWPQP
ncbi:hypothetical protein CJF30_00009719 [Rutstroemia sp. NJR-2017a BBW]|nr:hypothetical protein CJF30_00009719 [Rutstroemia sp. NJR-2017a BBW]